MSNRSGSSYSAPTDADRRPFLLAASTADGVTPVVLEADPSTHALTVGATFSASSIAINDGSTTSRKASVLALTDSNPLTAAIVDGNGDQITSFGGGTQYATGSAEATPTGTVALGWDGTDVKALPLDASGYLEVNIKAGGGSGGTSSSFSSTFPSTGTAIGATDGTNMQPLNVDGSGNLKAILENSSIAVTGTFWQTTQPISAASLPLPTGAATSAKQPALGTAGTPSSDVITIQGVTSMTALKVDGSGVTQPVSGTITANAGTNLNTSALALESGGNLAQIVVETSDTTTNTADIVTNTTNIPNVIGTAGSAVPTKLVQIGGSDGTDARAIKTDSSGNVDVNVQGTVPVSGTFWQTTQPVSWSGQSVAATQSGTWNIGLNAGSNLIGKVGIDQTTNGTTNAVVTVPATSGGLSYYSGSVGATATSIKSSAGQLYGYHLFNTTAAVAYVQIFNVAAGSVTLGSTPPDLSIGIPASGGVTVNFDKGIAFSTAISFACTTTRNGSTGATCDVNFLYN